MQGAGLRCERMSEFVLSGEGSHSDWEFLELMDMRTKTSSYLWVGIPQQKEAEIQSNNM